MFSELKKPSTSQSKLESERRKSKSSRSGANFLHDNRVLPTMQRINCQSPNSNYCQGREVIQGDFIKRDITGNEDTVGGEPGPTMKPWIDPSTGRQKTTTGLKVYFQFDKDGLERQKHKGIRKNGVTSGLELGDENEYNSLSMTSAWPGSRTWPSSMRGAHQYAHGVTKGSALNQRNNTPGAANTTAASWGHQIAMQWGGAANLDNAVSATNEANSGQQFAQEQYQTIVEDAVNKVVANNGLSLNQFRMKHTAYKYPDSNVAKYVRFKIYKHDNLASKWILLVDQITPDFAQFLAGGSATLGSSRQVFQSQIETQLSGMVPAHEQKHGTDSQTVKSWDSTVNRGPFATIEYPKANETIQSDNYSLKVKANALTNNVEVLIQHKGTTGKWNQTRQTSDGTWWYDWQSIQLGEYDIQPRAWKEDGQMVKGSMVSVSRH